MNAESVFFSSSPTTDTTQHLPVLLEETVAALQPRPGGRYLDGTLGLGGHALAVLCRSAEDVRREEQIPPERGQPPDSERSLGGNIVAHVCGLDRDAQALHLARTRLAPFGDHVHFFHRRYSEFAGALDILGWDTVDGALIDIGTSSLQIDSPERGFSFLANGPLDMRMDRDSGEAPVSRLVNRASFDELKEIIARYGEDPQAGRIARAIVEARARKPLETTGELAALVERAYPAAWRARARNHPATRTFQALRMVVNDELGELERFLDAILPRLAPGARLAVISFHSLEDRIVKHKMRGWARACICPAHIPVCTCGHEPEVRLITTKPVVPGSVEVKRNPRAASARLRVVEKILPGDSGIRNGRERYEAKRAARAKKEAERMEK